MKEHHEIREIEKIPPTELDSYLSQFFLAARTKTSKDYEPSSLSGVRASVERHLSHSSYGITIFKDSRFKKQETRKWNKSNSNNMDLQTDQKPHWLLWMMKLGFFLTKSCLDLVHRKLC